MKNIVVAIIGLLIAAAYFATFVCFVIEKVQLMIAFFVCHKKEKCKDYLCSMYLCCPRSVPCDAYRTFIYNKIDETFDKSP